MFRKLFDAVNPWSFVEEWLKEVGKDIVLSSQYICLIAGLIGLIMYVFGCKKGKTTATVAPIIYLIIRILGNVLLGI